MNTLDQLPFELLSRILDHLQDEDVLACVLVNKRFHKAALSLLWRKLDIQSDKVLEMIITILSTSSSTPGHHVRSLRVSSCETISDTHLLAIVEHVPYLEKLHLPQAHYFTDTGFQQVPGYCPHLTSVDLEDDIRKYDRFEMTNASMLALGQHCHQLTHLSLSYMRNLDYVTLLDHFHDCPLTYIKLEPYGMTTSAKELFAERATLSAHRHHRQTLTSLYIGCAGDDFLTSIHAHQLVWPHLTSFYINGCHSLTDAIATTFIQAHPKLQKLAIRGSHYLTDQYLDNVMRYIPDLLSLNVGWNIRLTASGICRLIKHYDGQLTGSITCYGCRIYPHDDDFPEDLDGNGYERMNVEGDDDTEVICFYVNAFT